MGDPASSRPRPDTGKAAVEQLASSLADDRAMYTGGHGVAYRASTTLRALQTEREALQDALRELHAQVWGECPSLLNEDSGGDARLDLRIRELLSGDLP